MGISLVDVWNTKHGRTFIIKSSEKNRTCAERNLNWTLDWLWNVARVIYWRNFFQVDMLMYQFDYRKCYFNMWLTASKCTKQKKNLSIHTVINRHNKLKRKASNQLFLFPVEKLKSQLLAAYSLLDSVSLYEPKIINEFTMDKLKKKYPPSWLFSFIFYFFIYWIRLMVLCEFIHRYSSKRSLRFVCITI